MDIKSYMNEMKGLVDKALEEYLPEDAEIPEPLKSSMRYSLFAGGKRLRPALAIAASDAAGGRRENALPFAAALEMIHTYTLIHDDLPSLDDDDLRRGKKTNHKVFGEAMAILAGDALQTYAFQLMTDRSKVDVPAEIILQASHELAVAIGAEGTVAGQVVDLESEGKSIDAETMEYIHARKTGKLIKASIRGGALLGGSGGEELEAMAAFGEGIGLAFQIIDDILDIEGTDEALGKDAGSDLEKGKATYPSIFGIEKSREIASGLVESSIAKLSLLGERAEPLREIARYFLSRTY
ncbi:MAG: polyprenyl synthetase family protein [Nitrospinae bacterium]|nr:polyprenyl synthetase family protein [Nitrospinota bacterium]